MKLLNLYRNAYTGLPKNIWLLSIIMLINRSGTMVVAFLTLYCTQYLHVSVWGAGIAVACYGMGAILGAYIGGRCSDKFGYHKVQVVALIGGGTMFLITALVTQFPIFCTCIFLLAAVNESFRPANTSAVAANSDGNNRTRSFALLRLAMNMGWSVGTVIGGILSTINYNLLFWVDGCTSIVAGIVMLQLKFKPLTKVTVVDSTLAKTPFQNKQFLIFIAGTILFTFCFFQLFCNLPLFYKNGLHLNEKIIGIILAMNGLLIVVFEMVIVKSAETRFSKKALIITGTIGMAVFFLLSSNNAFNVYFIAFGGMLLITVSEMIALPFMNSYYLSYSSNGNTGKYAAIYTMSWSIGQILAGFVGGSLIVHLGFDALWLICAFLCIICAFVYLKILR